MPILNTLPERAKALQPVIDNVIATIFHAERTNKKSLFSNVLNRDFFILVMVKELLLR